MIIFYDSRKCSHSYLYYLIASQLLLIFLISFLTSSLLFTNIIFFLILSRYPFLHRPASYPTFLHITRRHSDLLFQLYDPLQCQRIEDRFCFSLTCHPTTIFCIHHLTTIALYQRHLMVLQKAWVTIKIYQNCVRFGCVPPYFYSTCEGSQI